MTEHEQAVSLFNAVNNAAIITADVTMRADAMKLPKERIDALAKAGALFTAIRDEMQKKLAAP